MLVENRPGANSMIGTAGERPEEFAAYVRAEIQRWGKVIKDANIKAE